MGLDSGLPEQRVATIVKQVSPRELLSSGAYLALATRLTDDVIQVASVFFFRWLQKYLVVLWSKLA